MALKDSVTVFQYKKGRGFLYRIPALPKLAMLLSLTVIIMFLPLYATCGGIIILVIPAFLCGFTLREQFTDIRPAVFYAFFLYLPGIFTALPSLNVTALTAGDLLTVFYPDYDYARYVLRLLLVMQLSALLFRTTTSIETKEAICTVETAIRGTVKKLPFARTVSTRPKFGTSIALTINFMPALFELWDKLNRAYRARGGKRGIKRARVLLVALFALSFHYAEKKARALAARELV
jgi:biotin transport system permease protein/energy-coupling factor transport system permease protein